MMYIGQILRQKRDALNWKQQHVAQKLGISQATLSRIESNQQSISDEEVQKFAQILETTVEELKESVKSNLQTNHDTAAFQQALAQFQEVSQQMMVMMQELKADKEFLKEENRQLRQRDEKWMQMLIDMQSQLVVFLNKNR